MITVTEAAAKKAKVLLHKMQEENGTGCNGSWTAKCLELRVYNSIARDFNRKLYHVSAGGCTDDSDAVGIFDCANVTRIFVVIDSLRRIHWLWCPNNRPAL